MNRFEKHPRLFLGLFLLLLLPLLDLAAGVSYRLVTGHTWHQRLIGTVLDQNDYRVSHPLYHHGLIPRISAHSHWGSVRYLIQTNSLGFKDASTRDVPLEYDGYRMVFIGDSFTEGLGIPYQETFVGLADAWLRPRGVDVLNAGVATYAPMIHYRRVRHLLEVEGLRFDELVVFLDLSDALDHQTKYAWDAQKEAVVWRLGGRVSPGEPARVRLPESWRERWIWGNLLLLEQIRYWIDFRQRPLWQEYERYGNTSEARLDRPAAIWTTRETDYGQPGLESMTRFMDLLAGVLRERGIRLTVAVYPWPDQIIGEELDSLHVRHWQAWSARQGADFIDLFPNFIQKRTREETLALLDMLFFVGDIHWTAAGHRVVANGLLDYLKKRAAAGDFQAGTQRHSGGATTSR
ncbi:MAG: hypothetical protein HQL82_00655 [Magnetococcales bacterium]|nr:hypothetical protein [Magnetococcales bacterium]